MTAVGERLTERIRASGPISLADYMEACNDAYYGTRDPFGAAGDFITAPEISQVFGELIGLWCVDYWRRCGAPDAFFLVELGPGRGTLMADALRAARLVPEFLRAAKLHLVERSPVLRREQAERLATFAPRWHDSVVTLPEGPMLLVANEFLDALPIRQFLAERGAWRERLVGLRNDRDGFCLLNAPEPSALDRPPAEDGAICELAPAAAKLAQDLARRLTDKGGAALFFDYGFFPSGCGDTLQALRHHRSHAVLEDAGEADLTAHVDFAAFARAGRTGGAAIYGPVTQGQFLIRLGLEARCAALLKTATPSQTESIRSGCRRLIEPAQMGSLFKVLALGQKGAPVPAGFG